MREFKDFDADVDLLAEQILFDTADNMIKYIESTDMIPVKTHNLKDSTGIGVYQDSVLIQFYISPKAKVPRQWSGGDVWGSQLIQMALDAGTAKYSRGNYIVLFSAMPYAEDVDYGDRNKGFFTEHLTREFILEFEEMLRKYSKQ